MNILIIGTGAIGILLGSYLQKGKQNVTYITRTVLQAEEIRKHGLLLHTLEGETLQFFPQAYALDEIKTLAKDQLGLTVYDLVVVTVKQTALEQVLPWIKKQVPVTIPILFLMNGLGHRQLVEENLAHDIFWGITQNGARRLAATEVEEKGRGVTKLGIIEQVSIDSETVLTKFIQLVKACHVEVVYSDEIEVEMWRKCIVNACINPLTAIFTVRNGMLVEDAHLQRLMHNLYLELAQLITRVRSPVETEKVLANGGLWQEIENVCRITSANLSSMVQDLQNNRQTEIESITGFFLRLAECANLELPTNRFVYEAIHFLEKQN